MSTCKNKKCGCIDTGLTTPTPCVHDTFICPDPDPCSETFSDCCVIHTGDGIVELGINQGDSLCNILQLIALWMTNPQCADPNSPCRAVQALHSITVTPTTIKVGWTPVSVNQTSFEVEYKQASALSWILNPPVLAPNTTDTIGGLLPNTDYHIRVNATCTLNPGQSFCYSITILVKTKTA